MRNIIPTKRSGNSSWFFKRTNHTELNFRVIDNSNTQNSGKHCYIFIKNVDGEGQILPWQDFTLSSSHAKYNKFNFSGSYTIRGTLNGVEIPPFITGGHAKYEVIATENGPVFGQFDTYGGAGFQVYNTSEQTLSLIIAKNNRDILTDEIVAGHGSYEFRPTLWIGAGETVPQLADVNTEISLFGVTYADIVITGGNPFSFSLNNIS